MLFAPHYYWYHTMEEALEKTHPLLHSHALCRGQACWSSSSAWKDNPTMPSKETTSARGTSKTTIVLLAIPYIVLLFIVWKQNESLMDANLLTLSSSPGYDATIHLQQAGGPSRHLFQQEISVSSSASDGWDPSNPLGIPKGEAQNLPSIRVSKEESASKFRKQYGGEGDKPHLGGFTEFDTDGVSPNVWKHMITDFGVRSFLDVGCGRGYGIFVWFY